MKAASQKEILQDTFSGLESDKLINLPNLNNLQLGLFILQIAKDRCSIEYLSISEIVECAESAGVSVKNNTVGKAFSRAGGKLHKKNIGGRDCYKIMTSGRTAIQDLFSEGNINLIYVDGTKPRTDKKSLAKIVSALTGSIIICDPYLGSKSLDILEVFDKSVSIRFLTKKIDTAGNCQHQLKDFKKEWQQAEFRLYPNSDIHDRYIITNTKILLIGHGLKDIGGKESFIISINKDLAPDMHKQLNDNFENKWSASSPL